MTSTSLQQQQQQQQQLSCSTTDIIQVARNINDGVRALQAGNSTEANTIFSESLVMVRQSLRNMQDAASAPIDFGAVDSHVHCTPCSIPFNNEQQQPVKKDCTPMHFVYKHARTVTLPEEILSQEDHDDNNSMLESAFHVLTGVLIFNIALVYHVQGMAPPHADDSKNMDDATYARAQHLERAKLLYLNAYKLCSSSNDEDQIRDMSRPMGILNNLAHVFNCLGDIPNAHNCSQRILSMLSSAHDDDEEPASDNDVVDSAISSSHESYLFFDHASQILGNVYVKAAAAA